MVNKTLKIFKKDNVRGEDGYKTFSIRIKEETVSALDELVLKSNRSRNELINIILEHGVNDIEIIERDTPISKETPPPTETES